MTLFPSTGTLKCDDPEPIYRTLYNFFDRILPIVLTPRGPLAVHTVNSKAKAITNFFMAKEGIFLNKTMKQTGEKVHILSDI